MTQLREYEKKAILNAARKQPRGFMARDLVEDASEEVGRPMNSIKIGIVLGMMVENGTLTRERFTNGLKQGISRYWLK